MKSRIIFLFIALSIACKKPFNPQVIDSPKSYLVVEGAINTNDTTTIMMSRTVNLSNKITTNPVQGATVSVESEDGSVNAQLFEYLPGVYKLIGVTLPGNNLNYRLRIVTSGDNKEYASDFVPVKNAPPIDSVGFSVTGKGIQVYLNTQDASNNTRYYRFDYVETWKFHSLYYSGWKTNGVDIVPRPADEQIYYCYKSNVSTTIVLGSTAKLTQDVLYQVPITAVDATSEKIELKYSILLRQYALTAEAYKFWEGLKKNTEQLGSIFDAEPTQLAGNIHNVNDKTDIVIGYISAGGVSSKRIFIAKEQLPDTFRPVYPYDCQTDSLWYINPHSKQNDVVLTLVPGILLPTSAYYNGGVKPIGYLGAGVSCVDCTIRGTTKPPDFWK